MVAKPRTRVKGVPCPRRNRLVSGFLEQNGGACEAAGRRSM